MATQQCVIPENTPTQKPSKADERLAKKLEQFPYLPDDAVLSTKVVCVLRDRSASSNQRDVKAGRLAPPIKIGPNAVRFRVGDVRRSLEGVMPNESLHTTSPEHIDQLGHNGAPSLDDAVEQDDPPATKVGSIKRGGQNG